MIVCNITSFIEIFFIGVAAGAVVLGSALLLWMRGGF